MTGKGNKTGKDKWGRPMLTMHPDILAGGAVARDCEGIEHGAPATPPSSVARGTRPPTRAQELHAQKQAARDALLAQITVERAARSEVAAAHPRTRAAAVRRLSEHTTETARLRQIWEALLRTPIRPNTATSTSEPAQAGDTENRRHPPSSR